MNHYPLLEVTDLTVGFRNEKGLRIATGPVSFTLEQGKTLGIVGESGSGKSVTALALLRLIQEPPGKIMGGRVLLDTGSGMPVDLLRLKEKELRQYRGRDISMIFQEPMTSLNPVYTCGRQVLEILRVDKTRFTGNIREAREKVLSLFREVQLPHPAEIYDAYPHELSGGQKQRVMIAMAVACRPKILIADEPTTALDVTVQKTILGLMKDLQQKYGMSILFITHDLAIVSELADQVMVMNKGKIVEQGALREVFSNPVHPYTRGLLACRPPLDRRLSVLPTVQDFTEMEASGRESGQKLNVAGFIEKLVIPEAEFRASRAHVYEQPPILEVEKLKTYFSSAGGFFSRSQRFTKAVDDVTFRVYPGETLGLVGESGCGKTTLGRTLLNLAKATGGKILFEGLDLTSLGHSEMRKLRKDIQIIFQDPYSSLNPRQTAGSAIQEAMRVHHVLPDEHSRRKRVMELLEKVGLEPFHYHRYPHEFSGGQRQRVCIARALAPEPRFIICDESVSALDVSVQAQVLNLLNALKKDFGFTYIFISHDLSVVKFMSDRMVVMKDGKIEEQGEAGEIYFHPKTEYTRRLIEAIPKGL